MKETAAKGWIADGKIKTLPTPLLGIERWGERKASRLDVEDRKIIY